MAPKKKRCRPCWGLQQTPVPQEPVRNPWPQSPQPPPVQEARCLVGSHSDNLEAARQVARLLARHNEKGFQHITFVGEPVTETAQHGKDNVQYRALLRLALIGDQELLSKADFKGASHCGGIKPNPPSLKPFPDTPYLCDAGNAAYETLVNTLLKHCSSYLANERIPARRCRVEYISQLNQEHKADLVEAALAAADFAFKVQVGEEFTWPTLQGGAHAEGDLPTYLVRADV